MHNSASIYSSFSGKKTPRESQGQLLIGDWPLYLQNKLRSFRKKKKKIRFNLEFVRMPIEVFAQSITSQYENEET